MNTADGEDKEDEEDKEDKEYKQDEQDEEDDKSYQVMKVMCGWKLFGDVSYLVIKVKIVKEVKRSDGLWRFACGDVFCWWHPLPGV